MGTYKFLDKTFEFKGVNKRVNFEIEKMIANTKQYISLFTEVEKNFKVNQSKDEPFAVTFAIEKYNLLSEAAKKKSEKFSKRMEDLIKEENYQGFIDDVETTVNVFEKVINNFDDCLGEIVDSDDDSRVVMAALKFNKSVAEYKLKSLESQQNLNLEFSKQHANETEFDL